MLTKNAREETELANAQHIQLLHQYTTDYGGNTESTNAISDGIIRGTLLALTNDGLETT